MYYTVQKLIDFLSQLNPDEPIISLVYTKEDVQEHILNGDEPISDKRWAYIAEATAEHSRFEEAYNIIDDVIRYIDEWHDIPEEG